MDTDIRDEIDRSFGDGPPLDDIALLLTRGRASVRRRRLAEGGSLLLVAGAMVAVALLSSGGTPTSGSPGPAGAPAATRAADPGVASGVPHEPDVVTRVDRDLPRGEDLEIVRDGAVHIRPGIEVLRTIANPFGRRDPTSSAAVVYLKDGETVWWVGYVSPDGGGASASMTPLHDMSFRDWVDEQVTIQGPSTTNDPDTDGDWPGRTDLDLVRFVGSTERLRPSGDVTITEQRAHPTLPDSFATADDRSAVAEVESAGERWYVLARSTADDASPEYIAVSAEDGGATLDDFLALLRDRYAEGGGGLL